MADVTTPLLQFVQQETGNNQNTWGGILNQTLKRIEDAIAGRATIATTGGETVLNDDQTRAAILTVVGALGSNAVLTVPARSKTWVVQNGCSGNFTLTIKTATGTGTPIPKGAAMAVFSDGVNVYPVEGWGAVPVGTILHVGSDWTVQDMPAYLVANGAAVSRTSYAALFAKIGVKYGAGDGATTFNLPDTRDRYLRGVSGTNGYGYLAQDIQSHTHSAFTDAQGAHNHSASGWTDGAGSHAHNYTAALSAQFIWAGANIAATDGVHTPANYATDTQGFHAHGVGVSIVGVGSHGHNVTVNAAGGAETRPNSLVANGLVRAL